MRRTIVVIHPGALGDVLLAVPAMIRLRVQYPQHQLVLCAKSPVAQVLFACGVIDAWMSVEGSACADMFNPDASIKGELKDWLSCCDCAIAWLQDEKGNLSAALRKAGAGRTIVASPFSVGLKATHQSDRFCEIAQVSPVPGVSFKPLRLPGEMHALGLVCLEKAGMSDDQPFVAVHPGSGSPHKSVAVTTMATMIMKLQDEGFSSVVIQGPADEKSVYNLLHDIPFPVPVLRELGLPTLGGVLLHAGLFVGHDSGVSHLAALLGVRTIAIFGPTNPDRWAPLGSHVTVIQEPYSLDRIMSLIEMPAAGDSAICLND